MERFILAVATIILAIGNLSAKSSISFGGSILSISGDTILLDREGIFNCPDAVKDPAEAFARINQNGKRAVLLVAPSVYWLDDPDDSDIRSDKGGTPFAVRIDCDTLSVIGLSDNAEDIVFAVNRGQTQGAIGNFTMFHFKGHSLTTRNLTFGNYCNVDLDYPRDPQLNRPKRKDAIVQAQIGICEGTDRLYAENTRFISRLNLCPFVGARRSLYDSCYFECTDDALSGSAVYLDCDFTFFSSKPFYSTSETGAVFLNCDITCLGSGTQYFTKVPGLVTAIDTRFHSNNSIDIKWTRDDSDIICRQEKISLNGIPYTIDSGRPQLGLSLTGSPLRKAYKIDYLGNSIYNIPNLVNGLDGWDPKGMNEKIAAIENETGEKLSGLPVALRMDVKKPQYLFDGDHATVVATPLLWGGYIAGNPDIIKFTAENSQPVECKVIIPASTPDGLTARITITVEPKLRQSPKFKKKPVISFDEKNRVFKVDYALSGKGEDVSGISWCRICREDSAMKVYTVYEADAPTGKTYKAKAGDLGYEIAAIVFPQYKDSGCGMPEASQNMEIYEPIQVEETPESRLEVDFSTVPIWKYQPGIPGLWNFDVFKPADTANADWEAAEGPGWFFGKGFDASTGKGIIQSEKGARMSYVPARDLCRDMSVTLVAEPAKSGGQGFGSATSQYMDVCVKFDPINLDGYALRIERTPDHDRAVSFSLIRYVKGQTCRISQEIISDCYRTPCLISIGVKDGTLYAKAHTEAPAPDRRCCSDVVEKVDLSVPIEESPLTGFAIQHTGSVGPSSTLIRDLNLSWQ